MDQTTFRLLFGAGGPDVIGQFEYLIPGTYTWTVPADVYWMRAVSLESGQGGGHTNGGKGGDLRYHKTDIALVPGEAITVFVPDGGASSFSSASGTLGQHTTISRGATVLLSSAWPVSSTIGGGNGGAGGTGQTKTGTYGSVKNGGGGGGAGGYSGNGGNGASNGGQPTAGQGGGGGGGGQDLSAANENPTLGFSYGSPGRDGGGVGLKGQGADGAAGNSALTPFSGSSGSDPTTAATNGRGGLAGYTQTAAGDEVGGAKGGPGGARIIIGSGRYYPSTRTADE